MKESARPEEIIPHDFDTRDFLGRDNSLLALAFVEDGDTQLPRPTAPLSTVTLMMSVPAHLRAASSDGANVIYFASNPLLIAFS